MRKMMRIAAGLAVFLIAAGAFCQGIPGYLRVSGTTITGCDKDRLPANLVIPKGITEIDSSVFRDCTSLESVTIPASVRTIGYDAFKNCTSLESVTIPAGVTKIDGFVFQDCTSLKSVTIPETVTEIGAQAFEECSLESVTIPSSVRTMWGGAFSCRNLKTVKYNGTKAQWRKISIYGNRFYRWAFLDGVTVHCTDGNIPANQD